MDVEKLLLGFLDISSIHQDKRIDGLTTDEEPNIRWILKGDGTNIVLENTSNDWIKISFSTIVKKEGWSGFTRSNPVENSILVPASQIQNFIQKVTEDFIFAKNEEFRRAVLHYDIYKNILIKVLKNELKDIGLPVHIDNDISKIPVIVIEDKHANHTITFNLPKTESLLDYLDVTANFIVRQEKNLQVRPLSYLISLSNLHNYPLIKELLTIKHRKHQTLDDILKNMKEQSQDDKFLKVINYVQLQEALPQETPEIKPLINKI